MVNETDKPKKLDDDDQKIDKKKLYEIALRNVNQMCQVSNVDHSIQ